MPVINHAHKSTQWYLTIDFHTVVLSVHLLKNKMIPSPYTHHQEEGHLLMKFYDDGVIFDVQMTEEQIELPEEILEELKDDLEE